MFSVGVHVCHNSKHFRSNLVGGIVHKNLKINIWNKQTTKTLEIEPGWHSYEIFSEKISS